MKEYTWMVWQNNRLIGYVVAYSEWEAYAKASQKYGSHFYIERHLGFNQEKTFSA